MAGEQLQSTEILLSMLELMQNKDDRDPSDYIGHRKSLVQKKENPATVSVRVSILRIGDIDTVRQEFQCEFYMRLRWEEPELRGKDISSTSKITWNSLWDPRFHFMNAVKFEKYDIMKKVWRPKSGSGDPQVRFLCFISGTFKDEFKLDKFPFDYQDLSLTLAAKSKSTEMTFVKDDEMEDNIREKNFFATQEWKLCSHVLTESKESEDMRGASPVKYPQYIIRMSVRRQYKFYIYNVLMIMYLITALAFSTFAVKAGSYVSRNGISLTLLLTSVAFKYNVQQYVPRVSYLTLADKYIFQGMIFQFLMALRDLVSSSLSSSEIHSSFEFISRAIAVLIFLLINVCFVCLSLVYINDAKVREEEDRNKYIKRNPSQRTPSEKPTEGEEHSRRRDVP